MPPYFTLGGGKEGGKNRLGREVGGDIPGGWYEKSREMGV